MNLCACGHSSIDHFGAAEGGGCVVVIDPKQGVVCACKGFKKENNTDTVSETPKEGGPVVTEPTQEVGKEENSNA